MTDQEIREMCLDLLEIGWPAYVTTIDDEGYPHTRAMFNLRNKSRFPKLIPLFKRVDDDFLILLTTNTSSSKIAHIKKRPQASIYFCDPDTWRGVMFGGEFEIVTDLSVKEEMWHDEWTRYYPSGYNDPDHTALQMRPKSAEGWTGSQTFKLEIGD